MTAGYSRLAGTKGYEKYFVASFGEERVSLGLPPRLKLRTGREEEKVVLSYGDPDRRAHLATFWLDPRKIEEVPLESIYPFSTYRSRYSAVCIGWLPPHLVAYFQNQHGKELHTVCDWHILAFECLLESFENPRGACPECLGAVSCSFPDSDFGTHIVTGDAIHLVCGSCGYEGVYSGGRELQNIWFSAANNWKRIYHLVQQGLLGNSVAALREIGEFCYGSQEGEDE